MEDFSENKQKKFSLKFRLIMITLLSIFFVGLILFVNVVEIKIINHIKQSVVQEFENNTGFHISYNRISPNILTSLDIYDVVLTNNQGVRLELGTIEVGYSLLKSVFIPTSKIGAFVILKNIKLKDFHLDATRNDFFSTVEMLQKQFANRKKENSSDFIEKIKGITFEVPFASIIFHETQSEININIKNLKSSVSNAMNIVGEINVSYVNKFNNKATIDCGVSGKIFNENQLLQTDINLNIAKAIFAKTTIRNLDFNFKSVGTNFTIKKLQNAMDFDLEFSKQADVMLAKVDMQLQHSELQTIVTGEYVDKFLPDEVKIKSNVKCDLAKNKLLNGDLQIDATSKNYLCFEKATLTSCVDIVDSNVNIKKCNFFTDDSQKYLGIIGNFPIFDNHRQIRVISNGFAFNGIDSVFSIDLEQKNDNILVTSSDLKFGDSFLGSFSTKIAFDKNNINIITEKSLNGYSIFGSIVSDKKNNKNIYITHKFDKSSINKFVKIFKSDLIPPEQEFVLDGAFDMNYVRKKLTIQKSFFNVFQKKESLQSMLSTSFEMSDNNFEIKKMKILDGKVNCLGTVFYKNQMLNSNLTMIVDSKKDKNVVYNLNAEMDKKNIKISVNNLAKLSFNFLTKKLNFSSNNFPLFVKDNNILISCNMVADLSKKIINDTDFTINQLKLFNNKVGKLTGRFNYADNILHLVNCNYSDGNNNLIGTLTNNFFDFADIKKNVSDAKNNGTKFDINKLRLSGNGLFADDNKKESYSFDYFIQEGNIDAKLYLTNMALVKLGIEDFNGLLNVRLHAIGKLTNPIIDVQGEIYKGHWGKNKLDSTFVVKKDMQQINVKKAIVNLSNQISSQTITINNSYCALGSGYKNASLAANLYLKKFGKITKADVFVTGGFADFKKDTNFAFDVGLKNISIAYLKSGVPFESEKFDGVKFSLKHLDNKYSLFNYGQKFIDVVIDTVKQSGYAYLYNDKKQIFACNVSNDAAANQGEGNITGKARFNQFPANVAHRIVFPFVGIENGLLDGELKISGSLKDPKINGRASLYYGQATLKDYLPDPISNITGIIVFDNNKILVNNVNGMVKKGLVHANGQVVFNKGKFENLHFDITSNTIPTKINQGPVDIVGVGHLDSFVIDGHPGSYNFAGNITAESVEVNLSNFGTMAKDKKSTAPRVYPLNVELNIIAGDKVKVNYPIINVHVKQGEIFTFHYAGNEPAIYLGGEVNVEKGTLNYFNKEFKIENASFTFFDDEQKINPFVNLKSYYRTKDSKNSNVMVYLTINDRLSSFKTNVSAIPYKSVSEINSILGTSFATNDDEREVYNDYNYTPDIESVVNTTNYLSSAFMFSPVENALKRVTGFDTFSVNTSIFGNMIKSNNNWLDLIDNTQLSFGKYLTNEIYIGSVMSFQKLSGAGTDHLFLPFQDNNYGINMELFMQLELPYLSIGYKFMPKDYSNILKAEHQISVEANFKF